MDEYEHDFSENQAFRENEVIKENVFTKENQVVNENVETQEFTDPSLDEANRGEKETIDRSKRNRALSVMTGSLTAVVAAVVVGMTSYMNVGMKASFSNFLFADSAITCDINVESMTEKENVIVYIYEENELVSDGRITFEVTDFVDNTLSFSYLVDANRVNELLKTDPDKSIAYRFDLKANVGLNVERSFDSYVLKIDEVSSHFDGVDCWCTCGVDHCYNFKLNYVDDYNIFSDFEAFIEDAFENVSYCEWNDDPHSPQKINVLELVGSKATLYISFASTSQAERIEIVQEINL